MTATRREDACPPYLAQGDFVYRSKAVPVIERARGVYLQDTEGRRYLDAEAANGSASLGYDEGILARAMRRVGEMPSTPVFMETALRRRVAERLERFVGEAVGARGRVAFELGGAQGMELAMKIARLTTGGSQFVVFEGGYHGRSAYTSQLSASHRYRSINGDWRVPVTRLPYPDCEQCRFGQVRASCKLECTAYVDGLVASEVAGFASPGRAPDVAAFVVEPLLNTGGMVRPDPAYLGACVDRLRALGARIVADETFTGFHRSGPRFGFQKMGFTPDIVVIGKALTNGLVPLSCVWAREELMAPDVFPPGTHSATYINNAVALAVADAVLDRYTGDSTFAMESAVAAIEARLRAALDVVAARSRLVKSVAVHGAMGRLLLHADRAGDVVEAARSVAALGPVDGVSGVLLSASGMARNVVAFSPALTFSEGDFELLTKLLVATFDKLA